MTLLEASEMLGKATMVSFRNLWILMGSWVINSYIYHFISYIDIRNQFLSIIFSLAIVYGLDLTVGKVLLKILYWFMDHSKDRLDKRLYPMFSGIPTFVMAFIILGIFQKGFGITPPPIRHDMFPYLFFLNMIVVATGFTLSVVMEKKLK